MAEARGRRVRSRSASARRCSTSASRSPPCGPPRSREPPASPGDALDLAWCGGDLGVEACAAHGRARARARALASAWQTASRARAGSQEGSLLRAPVDAARGRPRDVLGFKAGPRNLRARQGPRPPRLGRRRRRPRMLAACSSSCGGSLSALEEWRALPGGRAGTRDRPRPRHRCAARSRPDFQPLPRSARRAMRRSRAARQLRRGDAARGYAFDAGLFFMAYQRDPRRQFVPVQRRLAERDALTPYTKHVGSAAFAVPPGARPGGFARGGALYGRDQRVSASSASCRPPTAVSSSPAAGSPASASPTPPPPRPGDQRQVEGLMGGDGEGVRRRPAPARRRARPARTRRRARRARGRARTAPPAGRARAPARGRRGWGGRWSWSRAQGGRPSPGYL